MVKRMIDADISDRADGKVPVWDAASGTHVYQPVAGASSVVAVNEVMNWPAIEQSDGLQPEWWEEGDANATLTDVDVAGEAITETYARALKVVTTAADKYAYQRYTYADQPRLKSGRTVSCRVAVWSVGGAAARVSLVSSVGELGVSDDTVAAGWTILTIEGEVLDGTYVELRLEVDNGTAYFVPLAFGVGAAAPDELAPRGLRHRTKLDPDAVRTLTGSAGEAGFGTQDLTSMTSPLAAAAFLQANLDDATATDQFLYMARQIGSADAGGGVERAQVYGTGTRRSYGSWLQGLNDAQEFEDRLVRSAGTGTLGFGGVYLVGWMEWA